MLLRKLLTTWGTFLILILLCFVLHLLTPAFLTKSNIINVVLQSSINAILAVGMTFVIITAGIDLSVGSILALSSVILGDALHSGIPLPIAIILGILVGGVCGFVNGALVSWAKLPPFIATLGMMSIARGLALVYTSGQPITGFSAQFRWIANGTILTIPFPIIVMLLLVVIAHLVLKYTPFGRYVYAVGGNPEASWLSGINVKRVLLSVYIISGVLSGIGAIILTSRLNSAQPIAGIMYELDAIAASVIGGTSLMGGEGSVLGTLIGALIMGVLRNGLNLLDVSSYVQQVVIGSVIILAVLLDKVRKRIIKDIPLDREKEISYHKVAIATSIIFLILFSLSYIVHRYRKVEPAVALIVKTMNNPFFIDMVESAKETAKKYNIKLIVQAPEREVDVEKQIQIMENMIQLGVKAIIVDPTGSKEIIPAIVKANKAGIPVIVVDTMIDRKLAEELSAKIESFIGSDNFEGGRLAGEFIAKRLNGSGKVAILEGIAGHETSDARKRGFLAGIKKYPGIEVVASQTANCERGMGFDVFQNMLQAHPEIDAVFAVNDLMALGAIEAISASGIKKKIIVVGFDANPDARKAIKEGRMTASVAQYPSEMGRRAVEIAIKVIRGEKVKKIIPTKVEVITKDNL